MGLLVTGYRKEVEAERMDRRQDSAAHLCVVPHTGGKYRKWRQNDSEVKFVILSHTGV